MRSAAVSAAVGRVLARRPLTLQLILLVPVWVGHSCPTPLTLPLILTLIEAPANSADEDSRM